MSKQAAEQMSRQAPLQMSKQAALQLEASHRQTIYEEFGPLDAEVQLFKPKISRHEKLRNEITAWHEGEAADKTFAIAAGGFTIQVGEKTNERRILSMGKLYRKMGLGLLKFLDRCKMDLKVVDALLTPDQQAGIIEKTQTGWRPIKAVPNPTEAV